MGDSEGGAIIEHSYTLKNVHPFRVLSHVFFHVFSRFLFACLLSFQFIQRFRN